MIPGLVLQTALSADDVAALSKYVVDLHCAAVAAERERCAKLCEEMGALDAMAGEEHGSAALVRVADRQAALCAERIRVA